jgi:hypothetical protein
MAVLWFGGRQTVVGAAPVMERESAAADGFVKPFQLKIELVKKRYSK